MTTALPTVRIKNGTKDGFTIINTADFDHDEHELFDKADAHMIPDRPAKVVEAEAADIADLQRRLGEALDRATEAESERDEMKARAEAAEAELQKAKTSKK